MKAVVPRLRRQAQAARSYLSRLGAELHLGSIVAEADPHGLQVKDHEGNLTRHEAGTILWTAGVEAPPLAGAVAKATGATQDRAGRIMVGEDLRIAGHPEIREGPGQAPHMEGSHKNRAPARHVTDDHLTGR